MDVVGCESDKGHKDGSGAPSEGWEDRDSPILLGRLVWLEICH